MIDLKPFCSTDETRYYINEPFTEGEWTCATNGHIIVRVPKIDGVGPCQYEKMNTEKVMPETGGIEFTALTEIAIPAVTFTVCEACHGDQVHDCPGCECVCEECDGTGQISSDEHSTEFVRGVPFCRHYIRMLLTLPGIQIPVQPIAKQPMPFKFDGGEGALMPLNAPYEERNPK
jgi:hypothetical protein